MQQRRIHIRIAAPLLYAVGLFALFAIIFFITRNAEQKTIDQSFEFSSQTIAQTTAGILFNAVYNLDVRDIQSTLRTSINESNITYGAVRDTTNEIISFSGIRNDINPALSTQLANDALVSAELGTFSTETESTLFTPIIIEGVVIGTLELTFDKTPFTLILAEEENTVTVLLVVTLILSIGFLMLGIRYLLNFINTISKSTLAIQEGDLDVLITITGPQEFASLSQNVISMRNQLKENIETLEKSIEKRTSELATRNQYLEATSQINQATSSILDPNQLIHIIVTMIKENFDLYYVGLFLVGPSGNWANLRAGTGEAGRIMLERQHRIRVGDGMIGWSIANNLPRSSGEASEDIVQLSTTELPETQSEAAIPLRSRGVVLGALTIQSSEKNAFSPETISLIQSMVDQVSLSIDNARLFAESQEALQAVQATYRDQTQAGWESFIPEQEILAYLGTPNGTAPTAPKWEKATEAVIQSGEPLVTDQPDDDDLVPLVIPIKIRDSVIGVIKTKRPVNIGHWQNNEIEMLEAIGNQIGIALESARLFEDTQNRAARERIFGESTGRIRESLDIDTILQTATEEIRKTLNLSEVRIQMKSDAAGDSPRNGNK